MTGSILTGTVMHERLAPRHRFEHRVCFYELDLDHIAVLDAGSRLFGYNRSRPLSLHDRDHIGDPARSIRENLDAALAERGVALGDARVRLVTNLRVLGYVFNPISLFLVDACDDRPSRVVAEVSNTFGERHLYVLGPENRLPERGATRYQVPKAMHVSPFFGLDQDYRFTIRDEPDRLALAIDVFEGGEPVLRATLTGQRRPFDDRTLAFALARYGPMPQRVTALIHRHALSLYRKGIPFVHKPSFIPGSGSITRDRPESRRRLRLAPPPPRTVLWPIARRLLLAALKRPGFGTIDLQLPDGTRTVRGDAGGGPVTRMNIHGNEVYRRLARRGRLALGEGYMAGEWSTDDLPTLLEQLAVTAEGIRSSAMGRAFTGALAKRPRRPASLNPDRDRHDIAYHYDLGNDLYETFLDETMTYSCAVFEHPGQALADAQRAKYRRLCDALRLGPDDRVLEIGCGWGGFAMYAAEHTGARVRGVTLSERQCELARARVAEAGLADRVDIDLIDYREVEGDFTAIVSIEMFEAIGHDEFERFFRTCDRLLVPDGALALQTITVPDQRYEGYRRGRDWIRQYIFPGSVIPSLTSIANAATAASSLIIDRTANIGPHYATTLEAWRTRFLANRERVLELGYDEEFIRTWEFYLAFCEVGFRTRTLQDHQLVLTRPGNPRLQAAGAPGEVR